MQLGPFNSCRRCNSCSLFHKLALTGRKHHSPGRELLRIICLGEYLVQPYTISDGSPTKRQVFDADSIPLMDLFFECSGLVWSCVVWCGLVNESRYNMEWVSKRAREHNRDVTRSGGLESHGLHPPCGYINNSPEKRGLSERLTIRTWTDQQH